MTKETTFDSRDPNGRSEIGEKRGETPPWEPLRCIPELLDGRSAGFNPQNCPCVLARASSQSMPSGFLCSCRLKSALLHRQLVDARFLSGRL